MNAFDKFILDVLEQQFGEKEKIVLAAFQKHFGFPLTDVKDTENLDRICIVGSKGETYRYRGEEFLYITVEDGEMDLTNPERPCFKYKMYNKEL